MLVLNRDYSLSVLCQDAVLVIVIFVMMIDPGPVYVSVGNVDHVRMGC
jgi:hypothetical protein